MADPVVKSRWRLWLLLAALAVAVVVAARGRLTPEKLSGFPLLDFVEYWAAGRLNAAGENPYDPERIAELEHQVGRKEAGILMWNPPWTLSLTMPFGLLPCRVAQLLWLTMLLAMILASADILWILQGGPAERRWLSWLLALTFLPTLFALTVGQISPLLLLGAALFLNFSRERCDPALSPARSASESSRWRLRLVASGWCAGASAVLLAIKPHLCYLFWVALLLWALRQRRWEVLAGGVLTGLAATAIPVLCNPAVLGQYWHTVTSQPPTQYHSPTLGTALRLLFGMDRFNLQFLALVPGLVWFAFYWRRHRSDWTWAEHLPLLLAVSIVTAAYGAWPFDLVLLLVPVLQVAAAAVRSGSAGVRWSALGAYAAVNILGLVQFVNDVEYFWFIWMAPALLAVYLGLRPFLRQPVLAPSPLA